MRKHVASIRCCGLVLWCITFLLAGPVFGTVIIQKVTCTPGSGDLSVVYKNQGHGIREGVIYSEVYNKDTGQWDVVQQQYISVLAGEQVTRHLETRSGAVVRRVRIDDQGTHPSDPTFETDTVNDNGDPRWGYILPTLSQWGLIVMGLLLLTVGTVFIRRHQPALAQAGGAISAVDTSPPLFAGSIFYKVLAATMAFALLGVPVVSWLSGAFSVTDSVGALLCAAIVAYWVHLLISWRKNSRGERD